MHGCIFLCKWALYLVLGSKYKCLHATSVEKLMLMLSRNRDIDGKLAFKCSPT